MDQSRISTIDSLLEHTGNCGLFQIVMVVLLHGSTIASPWSMLFMAYGNYNPGWTCEDYDLNSSLLLTGLNEYQYKVNGSDENQSSCAVYKYCKNVVYNNASSTIVTEWNLACDRSWITSMMISLQMAGVLIGSLSAGQLNYILGRKATLYGSLALHATLNLIASFSVNWPMFTVFRFCIGITCGSIILSAFVYPMEFVTNRWRGLVAALPISSMGTFTFSLAAMILRDWRLLHQATAVLTTVLILPVFWVPDSMRWLAVKNKTVKAEKVGVMIAKLNRTPAVDMEVITSIAETERRIEEQKPHFSMLDLYRHGLLKRTLILSLAWLTNTIIYYSIFFDVQSLSGNIFINMMIFSAITIICVPLVPFLTNVIGRKWGIINLMGLAFIGCLILVCMNFVQTGIDKGLARLISIMIVFNFIDAEWAIVALYCVELYPTVLRSLSYSHGSCVGRVGGMIAPFLMPRDQDTIYITQLIMLALIGFTCFCIFLLPETKGRPLEECVTLKRTRRGEVQTEAMS